MYFSRSHDAPLLYVYIVLELEYSHLHVLSTRGTLSKATPAVSGFK